MADEEELKIEDSGSGKKKLIIIIVGAILLVGLGVGGALLFLGGGDDSAEEVAEEVVEEPVKANALYVGMPRPFVFNVTGDNRERLVQIKVQLLVRGEGNEGLARQHIPTIEGSLLRVFSAATADQLLSQEGKDKIRETALAETQNALKELTGATVVERVLFTGFVMQ